MKKLLLFICSLLLYFIGVSQTPEDDHHWSVEWNDDFDNISWQFDEQGADSVITLQKNFGSYWYGYWTPTNNSDHHGEPQVNTLNNATLDSLGLVFTAKKEPNPYFCEPCTTGGSYQYHEYTSGLVSSWGSRNVKYGYIEARIKTSDIFGMFPAFWLWSADSEDCDYDEIDIFEMIPKCIGDHDKYKMTSNYHIDMWDEDSDCYGVNTEHEDFYCNYIDDYSEFHVYGLEWSPTKLVWYVDNKAVRSSINLDGKLSRDCSVIFNLAMNKWALGNEYTYPNSSYYDVPECYSYKNNLSINDVNATMTVDYVRYYKLNNICLMLEPITINSRKDLEKAGYFGSSPMTVKTEIIINGGNINNGESVFMRANEGIIINSNFSVEAGGELYLDVTPCY